MVPDEAEMLYMKGKTSQKCSTSDFNFGHDQVQQNARELGGSLSFCQLVLRLTTKLLNFWPGIQTTRLVN